MNLVDFRKVCFLKLITNSILSKNVTQISSRRFAAHLLVNNRAFNCSPNLNYAENYKSPTPTNRAKIFRPMTVGVTKANQHLIIDLNDENDKELGHMSLEKANDLAESRQLKLVIIDEEPSPPKFKLMTGGELAKIQIKMKHEGRDLSNKVSKDKEININLGISDYDLEMKIKMAKNFHEKGHNVLIAVKSQILNKKVVFLIFKQIFEFIYYFKRNFSFKIKGKKHTQASR